MVGLFLYVGEKPSTYGLPLFVTFVRPDQSLPSQLLSGRLMSNCPRMYSPGVMPVLFLNMRVK